jgi:hypothetical protein
MSDLLLIILAGAALLGAGATAFYRRRARKANVERQRLRDSLEVIDSKLELDRLHDEAVRLKEASDEALYKYRSDPWRPSDRPGPDDGR